MNDNITDLEQYKNLLKNKQELDKEISNLDYLSLDELEDVMELYKSEFSELNKELKLLREENQNLKNDVYNDF